ncbi:hypothetical protein Vretimale_7198, partial [Volvox reticuliferus]
GGGSLAGGVVAAAATGRVWKGVVRVPPSLVPESGTHSQWLTDGVALHAEFEATAAAIVAGRGDGSSDGDGSQSAAALAAAMTAAGDPASRTEGRACGVMELAELAAGDAVYGRSATDGTGAETGGSSAVAAAAAAAAAALAGTSTVSKLQGYLTSSRFRKERDGGGGGGDGRLGSTSPVNGFQPPTGFNVLTNGRGNISEGQIDSVEALLLLERQASTAGTGVQPEQPKEGHGGGGSDRGAGRRGSTSCSGSVKAAAAEPLLLGPGENKEQPLPTATLPPPMPPLMPPRQQQQHVSMLVTPGPDLDCGAERKGMSLEDKDLASVVRSSPVPLLDATAATAATAAAAAARRGPSIEPAIAPGIGGGSRLRGATTTRLSVMTSLRSEVASLSRLYGMRDTSGVDAQSSAAGGGSGCVGGGGSGAAYGGIMGVMPRASSAAAMMGRHRLWAAEADVSDAASMPPLQAAPPAIGPPSDNCTSSGLLSPLTTSTFAHTGLKPVYSLPVGRAPQDGLMPAPPGRATSDAYLPHDRRRFFGAVSRNPQGGPMGHSPVTFGAEVSSTETDPHSPLEVSASGAGGGAGGGGSG